MLQLMDVVHQIKNELLAIGPTLNNRLGYATEAKLSHIVT